jgi:hypothetical protein
LMQFEVLILLQGYLENLEEFSAHEYLQLQYSHPFLNECQHFVCAILFL